MAERALSTEDRLAMDKDYIPTKKKAKATWDGVERRKAIHSCVEAYHDRRRNSK